MRSSYPRNYTILDNNAYELAAFSVLTPPKLTAVQHLVQRHAPMVLYGTSTSTAQFASFVGTHNRDAACLDILFNIYEVSDSEQQKVMNNMLGNEIAIETRNTTFGKWCTAPYVMANHIPTIDKKELLQHVKGVLKQNTKNPGIIELLDLLSESRDMQLRDVMATELEKCQNIMPDICRLFAGLLPESVMETIMSTIDKSNGVVAEMSKVNRQLARNRIRSTWKNWTAMRLLQCSLPQKSASLIRQKKYVAVLKLNPVDVKGLIGGEILHITLKGLPWGPKLVLASSPSSRSVRIVGYKEKQSISQTHNALGDIETHFKDRNTHMISNENMSSYTPNRRADPLNGRGNIMGDKIAKFVSAKQPLERIASLVTRIGTIEAKKNGVTVQYLIELFSYYLGMDDTSFLLQTLGSNENPQNIITTSKILAYQFEEEFKADIEKLGKTEQDYIKQTTRMMYVNVTKKMRLLPLLFVLSQYWGVNPFSYFWLARDPTRNPILALMAKANPRLLSFINVAEAMSYMDPVVNDNNSMKVAYEYPLIRTYAIASVVMNYVQSQCGYDFPSNEVPLKFLYTIFGEILAVEPDELMVIPISDTIVSVKNELADRLLQNLTSVKDYKFFVYANPASIATTDITSVGREQLLKIINSKPIVLCDCIIPSQLISNDQRFTFNLFKQITIPLSVRGVIIQNIVAANLLYANSSWETVDIYTMLVPDSCKDRHFDALRTIPSLQPYKVTLQAVLLGIMSRCFTKNRSMINLYTSGKTITAFEVLDDVLIEKYAIEMMVCIRGYFQHPVENLHDSSILYKLFVNEIFHGEFYTYLQAIKNKKWKDVEITPLLTKLGTTITSKDIIPFESYTVFKNIIRAMEIIRSLSEQTLSPRQIIGNTKFGEHSKTHRVLSRVVIIVIEKYVENLLTTGGMWNPFIPLIQGLVVTCLFARLALYLSNPNKTYGLLFIDRIILMLTGWTSERDIILCMTNLFNGVCGLVIGSPILIDSLIHASATMMNTFPPSFVSTTLADNISHVILPGDNSQEADKIRNNYFTAIQVAFLKRTGDVAEKPKSWIETGAGVEKSITNELFEQLLTCYATELQHKGILAKSLNLTALSARITGEELQARITNNDILIHHSYPISTKVATMLAAIFSSMNITQMCNDYIRSVLVMGTDTYVLHAYSLHNSATTNPIQLFVDSVQLPVTSSSSRVNTLVLKMRSNEQTKPINPFELSTVAERDPHDSTSESGASDGADQEYGELD